MTPKGRAWSFRRINGKSQEGGTCNSYKYANSKDQIDDNSGNKVIASKNNKTLPDNIGNRIESAPTHVSGRFFNASYKESGKRKNHILISSSGYLIGGVNPLVAGDSSLALNNSECANSNRLLFKNKKIRENKKNDMFDFFKNENKTEYSLKSNPEEKRRIAICAANSILRKIGYDASVIVKILKNKNDQPSLLLLTESSSPDKENEFENFLKKDNAFFASFSFIINKIVNRHPDDRIPLAIILNKDEELYMTKLQEKTIEALKLS